MGLALPSFLACEIDSTHRARRRAIGESGVLAI